MGSGPSAVHFHQSNLILDFDFSLNKPDPKPYLSITRGPSCHMMEFDICDEIQFGIKRVLVHGDKYNALSFKRYLRHRRCCLAFTMISYLTVAILLTFGVWFKGTDSMDAVGDIYDQYRRYTYIIVAVVLVSCISQWFCCCYTSRGADRSRVVWRSNTVSAVDEKMQEWQAQWPQFVFTLLYPIHARIGRKSAIRGRIRVTASTQPQLASTQSVQRIKQPGPRPKARVHSTSELAALNPQPVLSVHGRDSRFRGQHAVYDGHRISKIPTESMVPIQIVREQSRKNFPMSTDQRPHHRRHYAGYHGQRIPPSAPPQSSVSSHSSRQLPSEGRIHDETV